MLTYRCPHRPHRLKHTHTVTCGVSDKREFTLANRYTNTPDTHAGPLPEFTCSEAHSPAMWTRHAHTHSLTQATPPPGTHTELGADSPPCSQVPRAHVSSHHSPFTRPHGLALVHMNSHGSHRLTRARVNSHSSHKLTRLT